MPDNTNLIQEKLNQAVGILQEQNIDAWLTFVRETSLSPDPCLDLILGMDMVWQSAFIVTRSGERIAIIGHHDAENVRAVGGYTTINTYVQGIRDQLIETLAALNPNQLALNYSENDAASDGLGHGLYRLLERYLDGTGLSEAFVSSEAVVNALRGRKSPVELERIKAAITTTQQIFQQVGSHTQWGMTEMEVAAYAHQLAAERNLGTAWDWDYCPTVSCGPDSPVGHGGPTDRYTVQPGTLMHMDFGVKQDDYCADLQRVWYVRHSEDDELPDEVAKGFAAARQALQAGFDALKPGVQGWEVDAAARRALVDAGYPEYEHAFGHHLGRKAHDGATVLGPRWERYGQTPYGTVEAGNVFAIELGVAVEGYGYVGLEENVLIGEDGAQWLSDPQSEIWLV